MASLTITDLDPTLQDRLRARAAVRGRSVEEEAKHILLDALPPPKREAGNLAQSIRDRFAALGGVDLPEVLREEGPAPPDFR